METSSQPSFRLLKVAFCCWIIGEIMSLGVVGDVIDDHVWTSSTVAAVTASGSGKNDSVETVANITSTPLIEGCSVSAVDPLTNVKINQFLKEKISLIEYRLSFVNYTESPLVTNVTLIYAEHKWSRVTTTHGQTLLSLAFNYGVLSMATLTLGTVRLDVTLADSPSGCLATVPEVTERMDIVSRLLMRDFDGSSASGPPTLGDDERICHEIVIDRKGVADFRDRCCFRDVINTNAIACSSDIGNFWLSVIYGLLGSVRVALLFFGPLLFIDIVNSISCGTTPYIVKLKEALLKTVLVCNAEDEITERQRATAKRIVDMRSLGRFPKLTASAERIPARQPCRVRFQQYDINVASKRTMTENAVEVGMFRTMTRLFFRCHLRHVGALRTCCSADMMTGCGGSTDSETGFRRRVPWINLWRHVSHCLLVVLLPLPYYIRLVVYYNYEEPEVLRRKEATSHNGLRESFDGSLLLYLTPTHPLFVIVYFIYFMTSLLMAFAPNRKIDLLLGTIVYGSFKDLASLDWTDTVDMIVANLTWPLERFGALGCLVGLVYWPVVMPLTLLIAVLYLVPTFYITFRMIVYSLYAAHVKSKHRKNSKRYQATACGDHSVRWFRLDKHFPASRRQRCDHEPAVVDFDDHPSGCDLDYIDEIKKLNTTPSVASSMSIVVYATSSFVRIGSHVFVAIVCVLNLFSMMLILSEVVGCVVEIAVFTVMGVVVNASDLLKYVMLFLMVFVHVCDCFNSVEKKYLKLNKALFAEVKSRIKDLSDVTSLPSSLQENRGFKGQELNEQASYESPDDIAECPRRHWMINDLILLVDSEDTPRIPKQLFNEVCDIRVAGVPGPVFRGQIEAIFEVLKVVAFLGLVFLVVLSFSAVYKLSTTNQMLATVVGGFLPMILRTFVKSPASDVELGTVSFKSKMDEVIKNFCQYWPIYDLPFEPADDSAPLGADEPMTLTSTSSSAVEDEVKSRRSFAVATETVYPNKLLFSEIDDVTDCVPSFVDATKSRGLTNGNNQRQTSDFLYNVTSESDASRSKEKGASESLLVRTPTGKKTVTLNFDQGLGQRSVANDEEIDILIYLPKKRCDLWLDEWSLYSA